MMPRRRAELAALLALLPAGCAPLPPIATHVPPAGGARPPGAATAPPAPSARPSVVPADSTPTAAALEVLSSIPEPLKPGERVAPPESPESASDTAAVDTAAADVPVPEPTQPLGERRRAVADTSRAPSGEVPAAAAPGPGIAPTPGGTRPGAPKAASSDTCWRVQVLAPLDADHALQARDAAASLLLVPMVVEREQGRYKVRTKGCMTRVAADLLKRRAVESGFAQAFRISGAKP